MSSDEESDDEKGAGFPCSSLVSISGESSPSPCGYCGRSTHGSISYGVALGFSANRFALACLNDTQDSMSTHLP